MPDDVLVGEMPESLQRLENPLHARCFPITVIDSGLFYVGKMPVAVQGSREPPTNLAPAADVD